MRSWEIAQGQWLPALSVKGGSFNSYPHIYNLETYLDSVVLGSETSPGARARFEMSPTELYMALASVLFHDIGKIVSSKDHAVRSRKMIKDHWSELGIPCEELAESLGRICEYHTPADRVKRADLEPSLSVVNVHPYGNIRQLDIASLLTLIDYMDSAYSRVMADYLLEDLAQAEPVWAFRRVISGVHFDHQARMIRTVLRDDLGSLVSSSSSGGPSYVWEYSTNEDRPPPSVLEPAKLNGGQGAREAAVQDKCLDIWNRMLGTKASKPSEFLEAVPLVVRATRRTVPDPEAIGGGQWPDGFLFTEMLVARQLLMLGKKTEKGMQDQYGASWGKELLSWTPSRILAVVMGNVRENTDALIDIRGNLASMGIPVLAWLIDHQGHLYNEIGQETFEPTLSQDYLESAVEAMWKLSTRVFGVTDLTYECLAAELRDDSVARAALAARRIGIITRDVKCKSQPPVGSDPGQATMGAVVCGDQDWRWKVSRAEKHCPCVTRDDVVRAIGRLGSPIWPQDRQ